jgi:hypothetical protein
MKDYLRWSLRQLYLIFFWPTQFRREVGGDRPDQANLTWARQFSYLKGVLPYMIILAVLGSVVARYIYRAVGIAFHWENTLLGMALGLPFILVGIVALNFKAIDGARLLVPFGVAGAVAFVFTYVLADAIALRAGLGRADTIAFNVSLVAAFGVAFGVADTVAFGVAGGVVMGVVFGLAGVVPAIVAGDAPFGVTVGLIMTSAFWLVYFRLITYPFDVALATATYYAGRRRPQGAWRAWRWCPVAWNEVIWLPLPFVSSLLALLVRQDRGEGFKQIAFVAAERKLQRRAAFAALIEVTINDLKAGTLASLSDVPTRLNWTTDVLFRPAGDMKMALPRFDRVAQHVEQYLTLNSPYRKGEALARAVAETEALQRSLIAARGHYAPRLLREANEWRRLLDEEGEKAKTLATREIPNPFVFGPPVAETEQNVFTGRRDIVRQIEASVLGAMQTPTLLLHGPRRMGKTSILNQLPRLLGPDFAPTVVDCQNPAVTESAPTLLRYLSRRLSEGLRRRRVAVEPLAAKALEREPFAVFDEWLDGVERALPEGMRALLCLDEYERLQATLDAGWGGSFLDALRHMLQHRPRVVLMFTGAHTFQELGPAWTDRFISARRVRISFLTREEVFPLLTQPIPEFDMTYALGALDTLFAATAGQPFLTQATAFELVQLLNEQERREATTADVEAAQARALVSGGEYFANVWSDAGAEGQAILRAVIKGETPPEFARARTWLIEHDVLNADGDFAVEMVRRWVRDMV